MRSGIRAGVAGCFLLCALASAQPREGKIRLVVCGDDIGVAQGFLDGAIQAYQKGILRCTNVIVPGPWFPDAVRRLNEMPGLGVGLHLAMTSEWDGLRYRPLTPAPTMTDLNGYLFQTGPEMLHNRTAGGKVGPDMAEVEREFRAQIEMVKRRIPRVAWIWPHMVVAYSTPELLALTARLGREYGLPLLGKDPGIKQISVFARRSDFDHWAKTADPGAMTQTYINALRDLKPGSYFMITHPSMDTPEGRALRLSENVAAPRSAQVKALASPELLQFVKQRGIELMTVDQALQVLREHRSKTGVSER
jgi:predicted glycoside hydrolase/deacetylase ChbG (UPF0249 family)